MHEPHPPAQLGGLVHVVRGQQDGGPLGLAESSDVLPYGFPRGRVQSHRRLVEKEHLGAVKHRLSDLEATDHPPGEGSNEPVGRRLEAHELERLVHSGVLLRRGKVVEPRARHQVFACGKSPIR